MMILPNQLIKEYLIIGLAIILWFLVFNEGVFTAIDVWWVSEIYNHCLFVLPCSFYLIYRKRHLIHLNQIQPTLLPLIPLSIMVFVQLFALVGDINILMHGATFTALPLIIWLCVGHEIAKKLAFPLFFMLFAIPVGDQLIPYLQELTTDISVPLLELTNVPIYRNGLYLDIPEGRFLVAEACSGISFLISSVVFGFLYAYISFTSLKKRAVFICLSVVVPILANALRVYGIVLTGHLSDMQYAVGADHLIYGGVFYTIVLFILILIGEKFRDKKINTTDNSIAKPVEKDNTKGINHSTKIFTVFAGQCRLLPILGFVLLVTIQQAWLYSIEHKIKPAFSVPSSAALIEPEKRTTAINYSTRDIYDWHPHFTESDIKATGEIKTTIRSLNHASNKVVNLNTFIAYYSGVGGELISSSHRLFDDREWALINNSERNVKGLPVTLSHITSPTGMNKYLLHWYEINGKHFNSTSKAKLYQAYLMVLGKQASGVKIIITVNTNEINVGDFVGYVSDNLTPIRVQLYQALQNKP